METLAETQLYIFVKKLEDSAPTFPVDCSSNDQGVQSMQIEATLVKSWAESRTRQRTVLERGRMPGGFDQAASKAERKWQ